MKDFVKAFASVRDFAKFVVMLKLSKIPYNPIIRQGGFAYLLFSQSFLQESDKKCL